MHLRTGVVMRWFFLCSRTVSAAARTDFLGAVFLPREVDMLKLFALHSKLLEIFLKSVYFQPEAAERLPKWGGGALTKKGTLWGKRAPTKGNLKAKIFNFLDIGIYPYNLITLSVMISIFVSLYTSYTILLKHHTLQLGVMVEKNHLRASKASEEFFLDLWGRSAKTTTYKEEKTNPHRVINKHILITANWKDLW